MAAKPGYYFYGVTDDELSFPKGVVLELVATSYDGWPTLKYKNKIGRAPLILLEIWNEVKERNRNSIMKNEILGRTVSLIKSKMGDIGESNL